MKYSIYLAGPWFTPEQDELLQKLKQMLDKVGLSYYSPKDECLFENGKGMDAQAILKMNVNAIKDADYVLAITDGKDVGTIWECGYAFAECVPIIYVWVGRQSGQKFNLMLAASGQTVCCSYDEVYHALQELAFTGRVPVSTYDGEIE